MTKAYDEACTLAQGSETVNVAKTVSKPQLPVLELGRPLDLVELEMPVLELDRLLDFIAPELPVLENGPCV